jgi:hypothetical protein
VQDFVIVESITSLLTLLFWTTLKLYNENLVLFYYVAFWSCVCDTVRKLMNLQLPMQSVAVTTDVVSSNINQGDVYSIMW